MHHIVENSRRWLRRALAAHTVKSIMTTSVGAVAAIAMLAPMGSAAMAAPAPTPAAPSAAATPAAPAGGAVSSPATATPQPAAPKPAVPTTPTTPAANQSLVTITVARTPDKLGDKLYAGDIVHYTITYTNHASHPVTVIPESSNLDHVTIDNAQHNCRWRDLQPGATQQCPFAVHSVDAADVKVGSFTAKSVWKVAKDKEGTQILQSGIAADGKPETAVPGGRPLPNDPALVPTDRADGEPVQLAAGGDYGVTCYRIPALAQANNGWILAAYDSRPGSCGDAPQANSIVQRISKDGGKSFEARTFVATGNDGSSDTRWGYSDPSYVVDHETGKIFLFFVKSFRQGVTGSVAGTDHNNHDILHAAVTESSDNGATWTEPKIITEQITPDASWASRFASSGAGIQLRYGKHKGRLIQQYDIFNKHAAVSVYSDDHGKTWQAGQPVGDDMDENKIVELSNGDLMINSRPYNNAKYVRTDRAHDFRRVTISHDGGQTWGPVKEDKNLPDPANNAQIARAFPDAPENSPAAKVLFFSSSSYDPKNPHYRHDGLLRVSFDDGVTWPVKKVFFQGRMEYSVVAALSQAFGGGYGLLYEGGNYNIYYQHFSLDWLGIMSATAEGSQEIRLDKKEFDAPVQVKNFGKHSYRDVEVSVRNLPQGWKVVPANLEHIAAGETKEVHVHITAPEGMKLKEGETLKLETSLSGVDEGVTPAKPVNTANAGSANAAASAPVATPAPAPATAAMPMAPAVAQPVTPPTPQPAPAPVVKPAAAFFSADEDSRIVASDITTAETTQMPAGAAPRSVAPVSESAEPKVVNIARVFGDNVWWGIDGWLTLKAVDPQLVEATPCDAAHADVFPCKLEGVVPTPCDAAHAKEFPCLDGAQPEKRKETDKEKLKETDKDKVENTNPDPRHTPCTDDCGGGQNELLEPHEDLQEQPEPTIQELLGITHEEPTGEEPPSGEPLHKEIQQDVRGDEPAAVPAPNPGPAPKPAPSPAPKPAPVPAPLPVTTPAPAAVAAPREVAAMHELASTGSSVVAFAVAVVLLAALGAAAFVARRVAAMRKRE